MQVIEAKSYREWLRAAATRLIIAGDEAAPRGMPTLELRNVAAVVLHPAQRHPRLPGRNASVAALVAETQWVLGGRDDLDFVVPYLPRMSDYSDDGVTLRGAYGPRLRNWGGIDQIRAVVDTLRNDHFSRRAVISLFDPAWDHDQISRDIPCTNLLNFAIDDGRLDLTTYSRSMDILWGSAINFYEWTTLQEIVAHWLSVPVGTYTHVVGSLHVYEKYIPRIKKLSDTTPLPHLEVTPFDIAPENFDSGMRAYFDSEHQARAGNFQVPVPSTDSLWLAENIQITRLYWQIRHGEPINAVRDRTLELPATELTAMILDYLSHLESK